MLAMITKRQNRWSYQAISCMSRLLIWSLRGTQTTHWSSTTRCKGHRIDGRRTQANQGSPWLRLGSLQSRIWCCTTTWCNSKSRRLKPKIFSRSRLRRRRTWLTVVPASWSRLFSPISPSTITIRLPMRTTITSVRSWQGHQTCAPLRRVWRKSWFHPITSSQRWKTFSRDMKLDLSRGSGWQLTIAALALASLVIHPLVNVG